jgi:hypothetical protein
MLLYDGDGRGVNSFVSPVFMPLSPALSHEGARELTNTVSSLSILWERARERVNYCPSIYTFASM